MALAFASGGGGGGGGSGTVTSVSSTTSGIVVANPTTTPALTLATLDVIATDGPAAASVPLNSQKITGLANGSAASDAAAFGQIPTSLPPSGSAGGDLAGTYPNPTLASGSAVTSLDSITDAVTLVAGSNITITDNSPSAGDITIAASGSGGLTVLYDSGNIASAQSSIDTGAGGIASGHRDIIVYITGQVVNASAAIRSIDIRVNNDSGNNYDTQLVNGIGAVVSAASNVAQSSWSSSLHANGTGSTNYPGFRPIFIPNYDNTSFWKIAFLGGGVIDASTSNTVIATNVLGYRSTSAISRLAISSTLGNIAAGSRMVVYGLA